MKYLFLLIDLFNIPVAVIFSFLDKYSGGSGGKKFLSPVIISGTLFTLIGSYFTFLGVWQVSSNYTTGWHIGNLPVEEALYFFCIPFPLLFCFDYLTGRAKGPVKRWRGVDLAFIFCLANAAVFFSHKIFGFFVFALLASLLIIAKVIARVKWLSKFYMTCLYSFFPLLVIDNLLIGSLSGKPIIIFNNLAIIGIRIYSVPVEMIFYNMVLILVNLLLYAHFTQKTPGAPQGK